MPVYEVEGRTLYYVSQGSGPTLVFLHGFPLDHSMWVTQIRELSPNYRVIVPDLRGFGRSRGVSDTTTMEDFADDLLGLLDHLHVSEPIVLCGLSMGGYISFAFARKAADRLAGLVLCDTKATADSEEAAANRRQLADRVLTEGAVIVAEAMLPKLVALETKESRPQVVDAIRNVMLSSPPKAIAAAQRGMAGRPDVTAELGGISVPTLVIVGDQDVISPAEEMSQIAKAIPGARFVTIPDAGHMTPLENPKAFQAALSTFLQDLPGFDKAATAE